MGNAGKNIPVEPSENGDHIVVPNYRGRAKVAAWASLVLTGVASATGTFLSNSGAATAHEPWARASSSSSQPNGNNTITVGVGPQDVLPGVPLPGGKLDVTHTETIPGRVTTVVAENSSMGTSVQDMEYARQFGIDPLAEQSKDYDKGVKEVADNVEKLLANGYSASDIEILIAGKASDENISTVKNPHGNDAGFGDDEPKNKILARVRAEAVKKKVIAELKTRTGIDFSANAKVTGGEEVHDPVLAKKIDDIAKSKGMSTYDFVNTYNNGGNKGRKALDLSSSERATMHTLESYRGADMTVKAEKMVVREQMSTNTEKENGSLVIIPIIIPPLPRVDVHKPVVANSTKDPWYVGQTKRSAIAEKPVWHGSGQTSSNGGGGRAKRQIGWR